MPSPPDSNRLARGPAASGAIPFNRPYMVGTELEYIRQAHARLQLAGDGRFTDLCSRWLERTVGCNAALLTHSCTAALEMAALLLDIRPGDEIVMPSFTFVSTANAFVLRGGIPVFVDIRPDTLNIDESLIEAALTSRTRAIVVVHYAGIACAMDEIMAIADRHGVVVVEDAAQGIMASHRGRALGSIGHLAAMSFHETKNIQAGEGGALLLNDAHYVDRARLIREKGTDRSRFLQGLVDRYTWVDLGSSYLPSDMTAAFLWGQMQVAEEITERRRRMWQAYHDGFAELEAEGRLRRPIVPADCVANAHLYYILLAADRPRGAFIDRLAQDGIGAVSHYVPLHDASAGRRFGRAHGSLDHTTDLSARLVRLPLWLGLEDAQDRVVDAVHRALA